VNGIIFKETIYYPICLFFIKPKSTIMNKYITEFTGTFFLVLAAALAGGDLAVLVIASALMIMIYAGGHISGGHYNPAVTVAVLVRGKIAAGEAMIYIGSQLAGAIAAAYVASIFKEMPEEAAQTLELSKALVAELLGTFALAYVVLNVATAKSTAGNSYFGLAIGFTVFVMGSLFGSFSGGAFNPAVAAGLSVMNVFAWSNIWVYLVACFGGGMLAAVIFKMNNPDDK
jgi:aquaporin Z